MTVTSCWLGSADRPGDAASQAAGSTLTWTKSPGAAKGRLVVPSDERNVFAALGMVLHAAWLGRGASTVPRATATTVRIFLVELIRACGVSAFLREASRLPV